MQCDDKLQFQTQRVSQICLCVNVYAIVLYVLVIQHNPFTSEFCHRQKSLTKKPNSSVHWILQRFPSQVCEKTASNMLAPRNQLSLIRWDIQVGFGANGGQRLASLKIWAQSSPCIVLLWNIVFLGSCSLRNNKFLKRVFPFNCDRAAPLASSPKTAAGLKHRMSLGKTLLSHCNLKNVFLCW